MNNNLPTFDQLCDPQFRRAEMIEDKQGAIYIAFSELNGTINNTRLAEDYFERSPAWLSHKIHGTTLGRRKEQFTPDEAHQLAEAFRDIARRLLAHADEIDNAKPDNE